ncbi:MAG: hypothetical protein Crog4KO_33580 [Crocinitomicaceae bacterium]
MKLAGLLFVASTFVTTLSFGQDVQETFNGTRILNGHSIETIKARILQFRIEHRFGDLAGANGGLNNFFGFDQAADIRFAFEYGITDDLMIGFGRNKGTGAPYNALLDGFVKYRVLHQNKEKGMPISLAVLGTSTMSYAKAQEDIALVQHYPEFSHRLAYSAQVNIARKFGDHLSIALMPTYVHRNYVLADDVNSLFALGMAFNYKFTKGFGIIAEYYPTFHDSSLRTELSNSLSAGIEWTTNGHNFKVVCTNSRGFTESQFIPYTYSRWVDQDAEGGNVVGQFRLGFSISRNFNL